jgi:Asp-tRNA(Asn)/Glu-tRNA(Gln) amidotransferase A subunit family amidase
VVDDARDGPLTWPIARLKAAYSTGEVSPVDVTRDALARIEAFNPHLHAFVATMADEAMAQAHVAHEAIAAGEDRPLLGVPVSIKDTFPVAGHRVTFGSAIYKDNVAEHDSGIVRRLRAAGAVFVGKTNTAEFGQSATTDNNLGEECRNPWDPSRTPGGSSGGAAASVAMGLCSVALGADGGGSVRIPAAFTGLFGFKPGHGLCQDEGGFRAMSPFVSPGPLARTVADARLFAGVLADADFSSKAARPLRVAWCGQPHGKPFEPNIIAACKDALNHLEALGHDVVAGEAACVGWEDIFGPLVLEEEWRLRGHLLGSHAAQLTGYERGSLKAAERVTLAQVTAARDAHSAFRVTFEASFGDIDIFATPVTAVPAFRVGERPSEVAGEPVDWLWGAFPFTAPFNVSGSPAASVPCGLVDGLPVGLQLVARSGCEALLLDVCEALESRLVFDTLVPFERWSNLDGVTRFEWGR